MMLTGFPTERYVYRPFGQKDIKISGYIGKQEIAGCETLYFMDNIHPMPGDKFTREESGEQYIVRGYDRPFSSLHGRCLIEKIIGDTAERR